MKGKNMSGIKKVLSRYVSPKPRTLGAGAKRVLKYASRDKEIKPLLVQIQTFGKDADKVQIREYANGVTFFENKDGLIVMGSNNMELGNIKDKIYHMFPIAATFRHTSNGNTKVQKFLEYLTKITEKSYIRDINAKKVHIKTEKIDKSHGIANIAQGLQNNRDNMLNIIKNAIE